MMEYTVEEVVIEQTCNHPPGFSTYIPGSKKSFASWYLPPASWYPKPGRSFSSLIDIPEESQKILFDVTQTPLKEYEQKRVRIKLPIHGDWKYILRELDPTDPYHCYAKGKWKN